jgi:hypothetical protein
MLVLNLCHMLCPSHSSSFYHPDNASLVWCPSCQMANAKKRLSRIQRLTCLGTRGAIHTTHTGATEALTCLPSLVLEVQSEQEQLHIASGVQDVGPSYLHPRQGHSSILMWPQKSDPKFNVGGQCYEASI